MYPLEFHARHSYRTERVGISVPVTLKSGDKSVQIEASIDTGAAFCVFRADIANALGLDPLDGAFQTFHTANSTFGAFGHEVELAVLGVTTFSMGYFFADDTININVLGRAGWLDRVRLGLVHHDSTVYLAPY